MEISSSRHPASYTGEEKYEMLELNRRLESYLNHVKFLEEENQLLWGEIQATRRNQDNGGQRKAQEEALGQARKELQNAWREKDRAELEVSNMLEEMKELNILRQKEKSAQNEAKRKLEGSRKALEDERRMQLWLREQAAHLEKEVSLQIQGHQEDLATVKSSCVFSKPAVTPPRHHPTPNLHGLGEEYSQRAAQAWHEAASVYQVQMKKLEESLDQTRAHMSLIKQEKKESQLQMQDLSRELQSAKAMREMMEKNVVQLRQQQNQDLQQLQAHVEALEAEKMDLGGQIGELLGESRSLLQMKMSLSLEVSTYRALLDSESLRVTNQSANKKSHALSMFDGITKSSGIPPGTQGITSCLFSSTNPRSIPYKANLMSPTLTWNPTLQTPQETLKRPQATKDHEAIVRVEKEQRGPSSTISKKHLPEASPIDSSRMKEEAISLSSSSEAPTYFDEPILQEDAQEILKAELESGLFSDKEMTLTAGHPQTVSSAQHIEEAQSSEDEEETEVSTEMAKISHAPVSAWEENETMKAEEREPDLANDAGHVTHEFGIGADQAESQTLGEDVALSCQEIPHLSADPYSPAEDDSELTWADVKEDVIQFVEEESLRCAPETQRVSGTGGEEKTEVEQAIWPDIEAQEGRELEKKEEQSNDERNNGEEEQVIDEERHVEQKALSVTDAHLEGEKAMETYAKDDAVGEKGQIVAEEHGQSDDDESLNISASWKTDSYAQENTLADTRPLIHYKSDEETDANIPVSHMGASEPTEGEREKHDGPWSQIVAKRFDTMEDLSEEPELGSMDDIDVIEESVQTALKDRIYKEPDVEDESSGMDGRVETLTMDVPSVDRSESELRNTSNENSQSEEETKIENYHLSTGLAEDQDENSLTRDEEPPLCTTEADIIGDALKEYEEGNGNEDNSGEMRPECFNANLPLSEAINEQAPVEELLFETAVTEDGPKEEDVLTFTDECSLHPESQANTNDSDLEENNSSEDESRSASQRSQMLPLQVDQDIASTTDVVSNANAFVDGLLSLTDNAPQAEVKKEERHVSDYEYADSLPAEWANLGHELTSTSDNAGEDVEIEDRDGNVDIFQREVLKEERGTKEKENDLHSFFSSSIKEGVWSETAATYDPDEQTERYSYDSVDPKQSVALGEDWGEIFSTQNSNLDTCVDQSVEKEGEEDGEVEKIPKAGRRRHVKDGNGEPVHAEDSTDGDSWSSGEE